jgi:hypothetical protein
MITIVANTPKRNCMYCDKATRRGKKGEHIVPDAIWRHPEAQRHRQQRRLYGVLSRLDNELCTRSQPDWKDDRADSRQGHCRPHAELNAPRYSRRHAGNSSLSPSAPKAATDGRFKSSRGTKVQNVDPSSKWFPSVCNPTDDNAAANREDGEPGVHGVAANAPGRGTMPRNLRHGCPACQSVFFDSEPMGAGCI